MPSRLLSLRPIIALLAALLIAGALQPAADAATKRSLSVAAAPTAALAKTAVTFSGKLTRSPKGATVKIQRKVGKKWVAAGSAKTRTTAGAYAAKVILPAKAGVYSFRAVAAKTSKLKAATSRTIKVTALTRVVATIKASPTLVPAGGKTTLSGTVRPFTPFSYISIQMKVGNSWSPASFASVDAKGSYSREITPVGTSTYRISIARSKLKAAAVSGAVTVRSNPKISTSTLPAGKVGTAYSQKLVAVGNPVGSWSVTPALPAGLTLNQGTGAITGTPSAATTAALTVGFTETSTGLSATPASISLTIAPATPPVITTTTLPGGTAGTPYNAQLAVTGNPAGTWSVTPSLPNGLSLSPTTGAITGTATVGSAASHTFTFHQTNTGLSSSTAALPLVIVLPPAPVILTTKLPDAKILAPYSAQLTVSGGVAGTWTQSGLPAGLSLNATTGAISGTPNTIIPITANVTVNFTDGFTPAAQVVLPLKIANVDPNKVQVASGGRTACRIDADQKLNCWGAQDAGQLANGAAPGDQGPVLKPAAIAGPLVGAAWTSVTQSPASLPGHTHGCGLVAATAYCWGDDSSGQLGDGNNGVNRSVPGPVNGGAIWSSIVAGAEHTCGITTTGALFCWGDFGAKLGLGAADPSDRTVPVRVGLDNDWKQVTAGLDATCAVKVGGTLWCWGNNVRGQLGTGDKVDKVVPTQVGTDSSWASVSNAASGFTCAVRSTGTLWCWGPETNGQLGNGQTVNDPDNDRLSPLQVGVATDWDTVASGNGHACATTTGGQIRCWGLNSNGQLGDNTQITRSAPVLTGGGSDWASVSVGGQQACAVKTTGAVFCWGSNSNGQLGINDGPGATAFVKVPTAVVG